LHIKEDNMAAAIPFAPLFGAVGSVVASVLMRPKTPKVKPTYAQPTATPRSNSVVANALAGRRGTIENQRTGAGGVESSTGKKTALGG
jgi:hypothetical protein